MYKKKMMQHQKNLEIMLATKERYKKTPKTIHTRSSSLNNKLQNSKVNQSNQHLRVVDGQES